MKLTKEIRLEGFPLTPQHEIYPSVKRLIDVLAALLLLILLLPLMGVIAVLVVLTSRGPVLYTQRRLTLGGRVFTMYKFRTMRTDAEARSGAVMAATFDPRVTAVGRILRKYRLDELPQLLNVLIGDMSMIGPRPERPEIASELSAQLPGMRKRLDVRAGLSGLAQVRHGYVDNEDEYRQKLNWDLTYVDSYSATLDLKIAVETLAVVVTGRGAR